MPMYLLVGFDSEDEAKARSREIALEKGVLPDATTRYWFRWRPVGEHEWALEIPRDQKYLLRPAEQTATRLKEVQDQKFWQVKTPTVYRYLEQKYIDEFFGSGRLRLASFAQFAKHPDEQRQDTTEGSNILTGVGSQQTVYAVTHHGVDAYVLSTSVCENKKSMKKLGYDGCFKITNTIGFGTAVGGQIRDCRGGIEGFCSYQDRRVIERSIGSFNIDDLRNGESSGDLDMAKMFALTSRIGGPDVFFVKLKKYQSQLEYRFVWFVGDEIEDSIFVDCPEALQFCERVT